MGPHAHGACAVRMRPTWTHLQRVTMAPVKRTKDKRDSRRKIRKLVLNRAPLYPKSFFSDPSVFVPAAVTTSPAVVVDEVRPGQSCGNRTMLWALNEPLRKGASMLFCSA